jgi:hypothetical protein
MKKKKQSKWFVVALYIGMILIFGATMAHTDNMLMYKVTIHNLTDGQPMSPPVAATHKNKIGMFQVGELASPGLEAIAEDGNNSMMFNRFDMSGDATDAVDYGAPVLAGTGETRMIMAHRGDRLSFATMLICTNDGFTGFDRAMMPMQGAWVYLLNSYDAGTEMNTESSEDIVDPCSGLGPLVLPGDPNGNENDAVDMIPQMRIMHHPNIMGSGDLTIADHGWMNPVVKVTVNRVADDASRFLARLSGSAEVPMVDTMATGRATFRLNRDETELKYELEVVDIEGVTQAHIHMGMPNMNGPVVAFLFGPSDPTGEIDGLLAEGTIAEEDLVGPLAGDFSGLVERLRMGMLYVNVHTAANPPGEIRGQIGVR